MAKLKAGHLQASCTPRPKSSPALHPESRNWFPPVTTPLRDAHRTSCPPETPSHLQDDRYSPSKQHLLSKARKRSRTSLAGESRKKVRTCTEPETEMVSRSCGKTETDVNDLSKDFECSAVESERAWKDGIGDTFLHLCKEAANQNVTGSDIGKLAEDDEARNSEPVDSYLDLLRALRNHEVPQDRKIKLAYEFVNSRHRDSITNGGDRLSSGTDWVPPLYLVSFLSEWVQTALISSSKVHPVHSSRHGKQEASTTSLWKRSPLPAHLDKRYWVIFKWCLMSGIRWKAANISLSIMRSISCVLSEVSIMISRDGGLCTFSEKSYGKNDKKAGSTTGLKNGACGKDGFTEDFCKVLFDAVKLLLNAYGMLFRPNLDLWVSSALESLKIAFLICNNTDSRGILLNEASPLFQLLLILSRGFARFLKSCPNPRKVFQAVVDKLLETLLNMLVALGVLKDGSINSLYSVEKKQLLNAVEHILKYSLFHPSHLGGYLNVCKMVKQANGHCNIKEMADASNRRTGCGYTSFSSYHKLLFQQIEYFRKEGKVSTLGSLAWIFKTFIVELKAHTAPTSATILGVKSNRSSSNLFLMNPMDDCLAGQGSNPNQDTGQGKKYFNPALDRKSTPKASSGFFAFFAELVSPLVKDLEEESTFFSSTNNEITATKLIHVKSLLAATNNLLVVIKKEHIYVPTEDTAEHEHLNFLKNIFCVFNIIGMSLPKTLSKSPVRQPARTFSGNKQWSAEALHLLVAVLKEIIMGIGYILELEYRVVEHSLKDLWTILLSSVAVQSMSVKGLKNFVEFHAVDGQAVLLASRMIEIFSELRQIDRPIFGLCDYLRLLIKTESSIATMFSVKCCRKAIKLVLFSPNFLETIATAVGEVPEGQVASFVKSLSKDGEDTLHMLESTVLYSKQNHYRICQVAIKALMEIYIRILEHGNVTASNCIQVGMTLRALMTRVISPSLSLLVDSGIAAGSTATRYFESKVLKQESQNEIEASFPMPSGMDVSQCDGRKHSIIVQVWEVVLRLYVSTKSLHRYCISLMSPKMAIKASAAVNDPTMLFFTSEFAQTEPIVCNKGFFSCVGKGEVFVLDILNKIEQCLEEIGLKEGEPLLYTLHCVAIHDLVDLRRQIEAVKFILLQLELAGSGELQKDQKQEHGIDQPVSNVVEGILYTGNKQGDKKKLHKLLKKLIQRASSLTRYLLEWIHNPSNGDKEHKRIVKGVVLQNQQESKIDTMKGSWDRVVGTLDNQTLPIARWGLLCQNINVWTEFASKDDLRGFVRFMLVETIQCEEYIVVPKMCCSAYSLTDNLLKDDVFYEQKSIREVLLDSLCQELEEILYMVEDGGLSDGCFHGTNLCDLRVLNVQQCSQSFIGSIKNLVGTVGGLVNTILEDDGSRGRKCDGHQFSTLEADKKQKARKKQRVIARGEQMVEESENVELSYLNLEHRSLQYKKYARLVKFASGIPKGYIEGSSAAKLASCILTLERSTVAQLSNLRNHYFESSTELKMGAIFLQVLCILELLLACCRSLESLLLSNVPAESSSEDSSSVVVLLHNSASLYWPLFSIHAVATCFYDIFAEHAEDSRFALGIDMLASISRCTVGLFTFYSQNLIKDRLNPLLVRTEDGQVSRESMAHSIDVSGTLEPLISLLSAEMKNCFEHMKRAKFGDWSVGLPQLPEMETSCKQKNEMNGMARKNSYGIFATTAGVSSVLWSIATTLESFDEKCHLDKDGCTKWLGQLPDILLSYISTTESFLTHSLQEILLCDEEILNLESVSDDNRSTSLEMSSYFISNDISKFCSVNLKDILQDKENKESITKDSLQVRGKDIADVQASNLADCMVEDFEAQGGGGENGTLEMFVKHQEQSDEGSKSDFDKISELGLKTQKRAKSVWKLSAPNVTREERFISAQSFADFSEMSASQNSLFQEMVSGKQDKQSHLLGELFMGMAAILKIRSLIHSPNVDNQVPGLCNPLWTPLLRLHLGAAYRIMSEAALLSQSKGLGWLILLLGVVKYMESVGSFLPYAKPVLAPTAFVRLIDAHISMLGALLSTSHFQELEDKKALEDLKHSIQSSFATFLKKPLGLHFRLALQTIERALLNFEEEDGLEAACPSRLKLNGSVVAGVELLSISLVAVSGTKRLQMLARYSSRFLSAIFSLIANSQRFKHISDESRHVCHLTSCPRDHGACSESVRSDDLNLTILKCIEILVSISSREVIFPMKANHVALAMTCPANLFKPFYQRNMSWLKFTESFSSTCDEWDYNSYQKTSLDNLSTSTNGALEIFTASCKLLRSLLRHRKRESGHCVALLGDSLRALLFFLEVLELSVLMKKKNESLNMQSAVHCASWLSRVYEEVSEHKETFGKYCGHLLSDYICIISGYGLSNGGLSREIEGTLRPGAYALVDACSADDLQQLHAVLGEGPRRSSLTALRHDYEKHFKYTGKV